MSSGSTIAQAVALSVVLASGCATQALWNRVAPPVQGPRELIYHDAPLVLEAVTRTGDDEYFVRTRARAPGTALIYDVQAFWLRAVDGEGDPPPREEWGDPRSDPESASHAKLAAERADPKTSVRGRSLLVVRDGRVDVDEHDPVGVDLEEDLLVLYQLGRAPRPLARLPARTVRLAEHGPFPPPAREPKQMVAAAILTPFSLVIDVALLPLAPFWLPFWALNRKFGFAG